MRLLVAMTTLALAMVGSSGCTKNPEALGLAYSGEITAENVQLLVDEAWIDTEGKRHVKQEIFSSVYDMIESAEKFILLDFFLVNDFFYEAGPGMKPLSQDLVDQLVAKKKTHPEIPITFISDPVNTVYGSIESAHFEALKNAGVHVVWTNLDKLRDSNPIFSKPWRLLIRPWGIGPGDAVENPMGTGRISRRSLLKLMNFKANHRKVAVTEKSLLVTSANPHSASSAHWNVALRVDGAGMAMACESESAILRLSGAEAIEPPTDSYKAPVSGHKLELLTERKIKDKVLGLLDHAQPGARIDLAMFYLSDKDVVKALINAKKRGANVRVILDPAKDAFGRKKNGIPNRQSAARLVKVGIPLRWADTHGEQCHAKMLYVEHAGQTATLLLGSCNYTRRNLDNFNAECNLALTTSSDEANMVRACKVFDRWWNNPDGRIFTTAYQTYEDPSVRRKLRAWLMESTGMCTF